jgi:hypothetical protein
MRLMGRSAALAGFGLAACLLPIACAVIAGVHDIAASGDADVPDATALDAPAARRDAPSKADTGTVVRHDGASCDPSAPPSTSSCVLTEAYGVFVSTSGSDVNGKGTRASPFASLGKGIAAASAKSLRVYVCKGNVTYDEHVELADGVSVYGGMACPTKGSTDWTYTGARPSVAPSTPGYALTASALLSSTDVSDLAFNAGPTLRGDAGAAPPGASSIGGFVVNSASVGLTRVSLTAGDGQAGSSGSTSSNYSTPAQPGNAAEPLGAVAGPMPCACPDGTSSTGGGGGSSGSEPGVNGTSTPPVASPVANGGAVIAGGCQGAPSTQPGANGAGGSGGQAGTSAGTLSQSGWTPAPPTATASNGAPGQGGGGGSWDINCGGTGVGTGGGGGGCGGCGGGGGTGGGTGGSSFALVVANSTVTLTSCTVTAGNGGAGGPGGTGEAGQPGGALGAGVCCDGTAGGNGGIGGGGAGGAGGLAYGIAFSGPAPETTGSKISSGHGGAGGAGGGASAGPPGAGAHGQDGTDGPVTSMQQ